MNVTDTGNGTLFCKQSMVDYVISAEQWLVQVYCGIHCKKKYLWFPG